MWHYYVIWYVSHMPPIYHVCNDRLSSIICEGGKIPSANNAWSIASISEIYEMEIHDLFMSIWVRLKCTVDGDPPHVTLAGSQHMMSCSVPSFRLANVCGLYYMISPQRIDWFHMLNLKARSLQGAILYPLRHRADVEAKVGSRSRPSQCYIALSRLMRRI